jgi:hypothetical protein
LFTDVPESIEIPEDNVIDEVPVPVVVEDSHNRGIRKNCGARAKS